jgi:putative hemolysin
MSDAVIPEVVRLPPGSCLVESGAFQVFCGGAAELPATLREIARLREIAFRAVGEGTGGELDLDAFDRDYLHLFLWDREARQVAGAYRIGPTDRILAVHGMSGLYTRTLFKYDERLIARLSPGLELGRAFVRPEYQRHRNALFMLWKGIGRFVARHPEYRILFGPVSISRRYSELSQRLLVAFLRQNHVDRALAGFVSPTMPVLERAASVVPRSVEEADRHLGAIEPDGKGMPVLLRQYLKLNARVLGFNVDPAFGGVIDALMMVDLAAVDARMLSRYMGQEYAARVRTSIDGNAPARLVSPATAA